VGRGRAEPRSQRRQPCGPVQRCAREERRFARSLSARFRCGSENDPDVPVAVEHPLERPGVSYTTQVAGVQHSLPVILADRPTAGHHATWK